MKSYKHYIGMATAIAVLLTTGCQEEVIDRNEPADTGQLKFAPSLGEAQTATRAGESDNDVLQTASSAEGSQSRIRIATYTGTPGNLTHYFSDSLGYSGNNWDLNSGNPRFLPPGGMHLYAYYATHFEKKGKLDSVKYTAPDTSEKHPTLTFTAATDDALNQVDLIAAKVEEITKSEVVIPFRHILSQINFGVKGIDGHQIMVKNIRINKVVGSGTFSYETWGWTPPAAKTAAYPYHFPNREKDKPTTGLGEQYKTQGTPNDSQNIYFFGDGGKFGPGDDATFFYAQTDPAVSNYATKADTKTPLHNSLMLLPQEITKNTDATVTFDYEISSKEGKTIRESENNTVRLDAYYDWEPNFRYVYLFKFTEPLVTFDVLVEPWQYYDGDDGIIGSEELNSNTLFQKVVRSMEPAGTYSVPLGPLISNFICDWSQYTLDNSFVGSQSDQFTLSFDDAPFEKEKLVFIKPPFGFKAEPSLLNKKGTVTFTPITSYYSSTDVLNTAISSGTGNHEFYVNDKVKLDKIEFVGSETMESSLTLHSLTPYNEAPTNWQLFDGKAVYYPKDYALTSSSIPYSYTVYTVGGLKAVFDWMNGDSGNNPGGTSSGQAPADRMKTNITLAENGVYDLATVYANATNGKTAFVPIGDNSIPYTGNFDGKGATVKNLYINTTAAFQGFFGDKRNNVDNLNLVNVSVTSTGNFIGGVAGYNGGGNIRNCTVSGSVSGNWTIGGIAGSNGSYIIGCRSDATVSSSTAGVEIGGICGKDGWINACYSTGDVKGTGGISGSGGTISSSYYVSISDIGTNNPDGTRLPSIAALNGKIGEFNGVLKTSYIETFKYVSGDLNKTPPSTVAGVPSRAGGGVLKGTFIQNWFALGWSQTDWDREMALLATLGMEHLVIDQVMEYNKDSHQYVSWYPASQSVLVNNDPSGENIINYGTALEKCMTACRAHGIKLFIGTFFDKRYWDSGAAVSNSAKWENCIQTANNVMDELTTKYFHDGDGNYKDVLAGWYFPYEVDDLYFKTNEAQTLLKKGIKLAMDHRTNHTNPNVKKPYLFSPFMNGATSNVTGTMTAGEYRDLWKDIIINAGFKSGDILSPQDCIGVGKLTLDELAIWMPELKNATNAVTGVEFWINVETFGPGGDASFLTGLQIPASQRQTPAKLISFSYPIYYSPNSDRKQGDHNAYKAYYDAQ